MWNYAAIMAVSLVLLGCGRSVSTTEVKEPPAVTFSEMYPEEAAKCESGMTYSCKPMQECRCYPANEL